MVLTGRVLWLVFAAAVIVAVVLVLAFRGSGSAPVDFKSEPSDFEVDRVAVDSPDLAVDLIGVRGTVHPDYIDWACLLTCAESEGCHGDVQLEIAYRSLGVDQILLIAGRVDAHEGETMRIARAQRPPVPVDRVDRVTLQLASSYRPGAPTPTPME